MDYVTLASQQFGGVLAAFLVGTLLRNLELGVVGNLVVGIVGGALGGLVLAQYLDLAPVALPDGTVGDPVALFTQIAVGAAGGALLAIVTGLLKSLVTA
jgi:uncharacterized membrane protein YeaQ/YmgE (transglycosylase-associated protein family)